MAGESDKEDIASTATSTWLLATLKDARNDQAWQLFIGRYRPLIVRYGQQMGLSEQDAQDAAQQTLVRFCTAYRQDKYDQARGRLRHWLFGIAHHQILDALRARRRREIQIAGKTDQTDLVARLPAPDVFEKAWEHEWRQCLLEQCLKQVCQECDPRTIKAFELFTWQGYTAQQVAEQLGISANAVCLAKYRILKRIRELLPRMEETW